MHLPFSLRTQLLEDLEEFLEASNPPAEVLTAYVLEILEAFADEYGLDDIVVSLEESGALDAPLSEAIEEEMDSNDEFEATGEEVVTLLEKLCEIDWIDDSEFDEDEDEDEDVD